MKVLYELYERSDSIGIVILTMVIILLCLAGTGFYIRFLWALKNDYKFRRTVSPILKVGRPGTEHSISRNVRDKQGPVGREMFSEAELLYHFRQALGPDVGSTDRYAHGLWDVSTHTQSERAINNHHLLIFGSRSKGRR